MKNNLFSKMSNPEFDEAIHLNRIIMRMSGVWPKSKQDTYSFIKFLACSFTLLFFIIIPQTTQLFLIKNSLNDIVEILMLGLLLTFITFWEQCNVLYYKEGNHKIKLFFQNNEKKKKKF